MEQYLKLLDFWNKTLKSDEVYKTNGKWINDDNFNSTLKKYINENSKVLYFGCGSGWALIEASYTTAFKKGIGIDQSINGIECASKVTELSNIKNIEFIVGDQNCLKNYQNEFDFCMSINLVDVLPDNIIYDVLKDLSLAVKPNGYLMNAINPDFSFEFLQSIGYVKKDCCIYKDSIFRGNLKTNEEWINIFKQYFEFVEYKEFVLSEREKDYPRRMFILKNF